MNNKNSTAIIYTRVSANSTVRKDDSLQAQARTCQEYCDRKGISVKKTFCDQGVPGISRNRMYQLIKYCKRLVPSFLVVTSIDRLNRDVDVQKNITDQLSRIGTIIRSVNETN